MFIDYLPRLSPKTLRGLAVLPVAFAMTHSGCQAQDVAAVAAAQTAATRGAATATITVDAGESIGQVPPHFFGQNLEAGDSYQIFSPTHSYPSRNGGGVWDRKTQTPVASSLKLVRELGTDMLRYPGGCLAHSWQWKKTIGPLKERPDFDFGLDEYLEYCRLAGADPILTVSDYSDTAADAADLVEYLNSPATPAHPWAMKRAQNGHPAPYQVKYFEMGNESDHGNHQMQPFRKFSAPDYADWFNQYADRMKAIDPQIQMGALMKTGGLADDPWNDVVLNRTKPNADFIVIHNYGVHYYRPDGPINVSSDLLMRACMAEGDQLDAMLRDYRAKILKLTGKPLPLALTEYNALFVQPAADEPVAYRYSLGAALFSADYLRILMRPDSGVFNADYWHLLNGYWGLAQTSGAGEPKMQAAYYLFRLWGEHFGSNLVASTVATPRVEFEGLPGHVKPAQGEKYREDVADTTNLMRPELFKDKATANYRTEMADGVYKASFSNLTGENYSPITVFKGQVGQSYAISFEARSAGTLPDVHLGLGLVDARGWNATKSGLAVEGAETTRDWQSFIAKFEALADSPGTELSWRLLAKKTPATGTFEVRNLKIVQWQPEKFPAYAAITAASSLSDDGKTLYLVTFNKHHANDIQTAIALRNFPARQARRWTVTGPALESTNRKAEQLIKETESGVVVPLGADNTLIYNAPAHSMTAWEFTR